MTELQQNEDTIRCLNCAHEVQGKFCVNCGQSTRDLRVSVWSLFGDFFGQLFSLDSKLVRSLVPLCMRPGLLTRAFIDGKRIRFLPPVRMYLVLSLFFFLTLSITQTSWMSDMKKNPANEVSKVMKKLASFEEDGIITDVDPIMTQLRTEKNKRQKAFAQKVKDGELSEDLEVTARDGHVTIAPKKTKRKAKVTTTNSNDPTLGEVKKEVEEALAGEIQTQEPVGDEEPNARGAAADAVAQGENPDEEPKEAPPEEMNAIERWADKNFTEKADRLDDLSFTEILDLFLPVFMKQANWAIFFMMPFFAMMMKMLYIRRDPLYLDHLIFAFHYHSFVFLLYSVTMWWEFIMPVNVSGVADAIQMMAPTIYLYKALRRVYGQGRFKTMVKLGILGGLYFMLLGMTLSISALVTFLSVDI